MRHRIVPTRRQLFRVQKAGSFHCGNTTDLLRNKYRFGIYSGGGQLYYRNENFPPFAHGTIDGAWERSGDAFPNQGPYAGFYYLADFRYEVGALLDVPIIPAIASGFADGVWNGQVTVGAPVDALVLSVDDGDGHRGEANAIQVSLRNDLSITASADSTQVQLGEQVTLT